MRERKALFAPENLNPIHRETHPDGPISPAQARMDAERHLIDMGLAGRSMTLADLGLVDPVELTDRQRAELLCYEALAIQRCGLIKGDVTISFNV